jgi:hypothetical protein
MMRGIPFRLVLCEHLALGVIADHLDVDEAAKVESFGSEHRHDSRLQGSQLRLSSREKKSCCDERLKFSLR